jgi:hypothetical protein
MPRSRTRMRGVKWMFSAVCLLFLGACASIKSVPYSAESYGSKGGMIYFLPKRDVVVTVTVSDSEPFRTVNFGASEAYADATKGFIAQPIVTHAGKIDTAIVVNSAGLLSAGNSAKFTSEVGAIATNIAKDAGLAFLSQATVVSDCKAGVYQMRINLACGDGEPCADAKGDVEKTVCGLKIKVEPLAKALEAGTDFGGKEENGLFYRIALPYKVSASESDKVLATGTVFLPNDSPTFFLRDPKGFFADKQMTASFDNGVATSYGIVAESELKGLTAIPAQVVSEYFGAIGAMFEKKQGAVTGESDFVKAQATLELQRIKLRACTMALGKSDKQGIQDNCS